jgi:hypothetical protein
MPLIRGAPRPRPPARTRPSAAARSSWQADDQSAGPPTTWDADSRLADDSFLRDPTSPRGCLRRPTDAIDACDERATTYSVPANYHPGPVGKQAMTRCLLRRGPPALHAIDGSSIAVPHTPPVACWLRTLHASPRRSKRDSRARRPCPPHVRARCPCQLPAGCVSRCAHDAARRCPKAKTAGDARPHCTHHHHRHHVVCSAGVV